MNARMGIPGHLDVIREEDIPQMVAWALREANPTYPVPVLYDEAHCAESSAGFADKMTKSAGTNKVPALSRIIKGYWSRLR